MVMVKVDNELWGASLGKVRKVFSAGFPEDGVIPPFNDKSGWPKSYAFETLAGGFGLMQILEKNNSNLKIRYKMANLGSAGFVFLPDVDLKDVMLDLGSGEIVDLPGGAGMEVIEAIDMMGRGDIVFDSQGLIFVRGASCDESSEHPGIAEMRMYKIPGDEKLPVKIEVVTKEGGKYEVEILAADNEGCKLEYREVGLEGHWGGVLKGLRAGVELLPAKECYVFDEKIGIQFKIQNVSDKTIILPTTTWRFGEESKCIITDKNGETIPVNQAWFSGWSKIDRHEILPGKSVTIKAASLMLFADDNRPDINQGVGCWAAVEPGNYSIQFELQFPDIIRKDSNGNITVPLSHDWRGTLVTGSRDICVVDNVSIDCRLIELPWEPMEAGKKLSDKAGMEADVGFAVGNYAAVSDEQARRLMEWFRGQEGVEMLAVPRVEVLNNERAEVSLFRDHNYVSGYEEGQGGEKLPVISAVPEGWKLLFMPSIKDGGIYLDMECEKKKVNNVVKVENEAGEKIESLIVSSMVLKTNAMVGADGYCLVLLGGSGDNDKGVSYYLLAKVGGGRF
jgi:hypothetical protein